MWRPRSRGSAPRAAYTTAQCLVVDGGNSIAEERAWRFLTSRDR